MRRGRDPISLSTASAAELSWISGIGPGLAERIVRWRSAHGGFRSVDDLGRVPGIGPAKLERIRPYVTVPGGAATAPRPTLEAYTIRLDDGHVAVEGAHNGNGNGNGSGESTRLVRPAPDEPMPWFVSWGLAGGALLLQLITLIFLLRAF
ncbi:MAG: ComEA family DNA-binding protein [Thermoleophilia bacterium]